MKRKLFIAFTGILLSVCTLTAQKKQHPSVFKFVKTDEPSNKLLGWESVLNNYVIVKSPGTVEENYAKIIDFIKVTYSNPEDVIDVTSENKFVRIKGLAPDLYYTSSLPLLSEKHDVRYTMTIYIKADRMKVELNSMEYKTIDNDYEVPARYKDIPLRKVPIELVKQIEVENWHPLRKIYVYKSSGKPKKRVLGKTDTYIENYFNGLVKMFKNYSKSMSSDSDW